MRISATQLGKRFNHHWIFKRFSGVFELGKPTAITGANGSGKSTLLQVLAGSVEKSEGKIEYQQAQGQVLAAENWYRHLSICTPYQEIIEEFTLLEFLQFHQSFKPWIDHLSSTEIIEQMGLQMAQHQAIKTFSSGMKQRVKLAQAMLSNSPVMLLDEPTSNLDHKGIDLYLRWMQTYGMQKTVLIASNVPHETDFCTQQVDMQAWK